MTLQFQNSRAAAHSKAQSKLKGRLYNEDTGEFLHLSGCSLTKDEAFSWIGFRYQFENVVGLAGNEGIDLSGFKFRNRKVFEPV